MVGGQAAQQPLTPLEIVQHGQVGVGQVGAATVDHLGDPLAVGLGRQAQRATQTLLDGRVAAGPGEDERDGRQQTFPVEGGDHVGPRRRPVEPRSARPAPAVSGSAASAWLEIGQPFGFPAVGDVTGEVGVDAQLGPRATGVVEQVEQPLADQDVLPQRHRAVFVDHHRGVAADGLDPAAELLGVAHRRRQADQSDFLGQVQDHLLPHRAAHPVGQEVHLVHHHVGQSPQGLRARVEHVAQHLGGHHHHRGVAVDRLVAGQQADPFGAVALHQIAVLLIAERLDRGGVETLLPGGQGKVHGELAHHRLAGSGRGAHQYPVAALECLAGPHLERIEPEDQTGGEIGELGPGFR